MLDTNLFVSRYRSYRSMCLGLGINDSPLQSNCFSIVERSLDERLIMHSSVIHVLIIVSLFLFMSESMLYSPYGVEAPNPQGRPFLGDEFLGGPLVRPRPCPHPLGFAGQRKSRSGRFRASTMDLSDSSSWQRDRVSVEGAGMGLCCLFLASFFGRVFGGSKLASFFDGHVCFFPPKPVDIVIVCGVEVGLMNHSISSAYNARGKSFFSVTPSSYVMWSSPL